MSNIIKPSLKHSNRKEYNWLIYEHWDKWLLEYAPYYRGILVDLGCGEAPYKDFFLQFAKQYVGIDWSNTYHNSQASIISDLNKHIDLPDHYADTIVSLSVMEHLYEPQIFLKESYRILRMDGVMILQVPWMWWIHEAPHDYFRYTPYGLKFLFENAGFEDIKVQPMSGFFSMWILKMNYFSLRWIKKPSWKSNVIKFCLLKPLWYIGQKLAPWLDSKHRGWSLESVGYFVIAQKKQQVSLPLTQSMAIDNVFT